MSTPIDKNFNTIIKEFNDALSKMGPGMGDPVTRGERALLKTFFLFLTQQKYVEQGELGAHVEEDVQHD